MDCSGFDEVISAPAQLVGLMEIVDRDWYAGRRDEFFRDREEILRWLTWPAWFLENRMGERYCPMAPGRYEEVVRDAILIPMRMAKRPPRFFPVFLGKCVQEHMGHHWEEYAEEIRAVRKVAERVMQGIRPEIDRTVQVMAQVHRDLSAKGGRRKRRDSASGDQGELWG